MSLLGKHKLNKIYFDCDDEEPAKKICKFTEEHNRGGFMLILNHEIFDDRTLTRPGTAADEKNLIKTFSKFNFEIKVSRDLSYMQIKDLAKKMSTKDFLNFSCLVIAVLSHGEEKDQISARDRYYEFEETIVNPIAKNVTVLGKPKIFIINACRGMNRNVYVTDTDSVAMEVDSCRTCLASEDDYKMRNIPYMKEILKLYSCYEGFVSYRHPLFGCRFINSLCKHLNERGLDTPIEDIFKLICAELTDSRTCLFLQCPMVASTLTKSFCLGDLI